jgi:hypothetical protein
LYTCKSILSNGTREYANFWIGKEIGGLSISAMTMIATFSIRVCSRDARWFTYFQTKNPALGKFWRALEWKLRMEYFKVIWNILR